MTKEEFQAICFKHLMDHECIKDLPIIVKIIKVGEYVDEITKDVDDTDPQWVLKLMRDLKLDSLWQDAIRGVI